MQNRHMLHIGRGLTARAPVLLLSQLRLVCLHMHDLPAANIM
jgi:hypothetical protein